MLHMTGVCKRFGGQTALDGISLTIAPSERVALLGPNGAGKTTLIKALSGRVRLDSGSITLAGRPLAQPRALESLGVVPQEPAIYPDLSARENLLAFGRLLGLKRAELIERVNWALEWIDLADRQHHLTRTFSGGMKRRVNIACGILHRPKLLILDEPTVGVDPQSRGKIFDMLDELHSEGMTIVLTTHHLEEASQHCDRIVIIDHGRVIADGSLNDLISGVTGPNQVVTMRIEGEFQPRIAGLTYSADTTAWSAEVSDITEELPDLLDAVRACGGSVAELEVAKPTLDEVFLKLTGRELRE
ncbi:MAG: ABC transporter ATP-binding protein [Pirellulales bacterium]